MLARDLNYRSVEELEDEMDSDEFMRWRALYEIEAEEQQEGGPVQEPKKKLVTDPAEIARWMGAH